VADAEHEERKAELRGLYERPPVQDLTISTSAIACPRCKETILLANFNSVPGTPTREARLVMRERAVMALRHELDAERREADALRQELAAERKRNSDLIAGWLNG